MEGVRRFVLAAAFTVAVCANGIPALRHDWWWPIDRFGFVALLINSTSGWLQNGIGGPYPYPGSYILVLALTGAGLTIGPLVTLIVFIFGIATTCLLGARALGAVLQASPLQIAVIEIFALFNPWTYTKVVAGHTYMVLAYGACFAILAELLREKPRERNLSFLIVLTLAQLQFFLLAMAAVSIHAAVRRSYLAWLTGIIVAFPIWIGVTLDRSKLLDTPFTLEWQRQQSVDPVQAIVVQGYFTHYADHFGIIQMAGLWVLVACAAAAVVVSRWRALRLTTLLVVVTLLLFVMGTRGPLSPWYDTIVTHVPESGVFRELYDLLGAVVIGYSVLLAISPRYFSGLALVAALAMASGWAVWPPFHYWVNSERIPVLDFHAPPNTRFALYPAYQPLEFLGEGSGTDRDIYQRPGNITPVNEYLPTYPVDVALSSFAKTRDIDVLQNLSVSLVVERPWLTSNLATLRPQLNGTPLTAHIRRLSKIPLIPTPEVTLNELPLVGSLANAIGSGNILFSDARAVKSDQVPLQWSRYPDLQPVKTSNLVVNESLDWVDVRFDFAAHPELGQGIGGAVTTSRTSLLKIAGGLRTLMNVNGKLLDQRNRPLTWDTHGYRWIRIPAAVTAVRCLGRCVVAAQSALAVVPALNPPARRFNKVPFDVLAPWLARAAVPANAPAVLRYNVAYSDGWTARMNGAMLPHLRLDAAVNGWLLPRNNDAGVVYVFHRVALAQTIGEAIGVLWVLGLSVSAVGVRRKAFSARNYRSPAGIS